MIGALPSLRVSLSLGLIWKLGGAVIFIAGSRVGEFFPGMSLECLPVPEEYLFDLWEAFSVRLPSPTLTSAAYAC